MEQKGDTMKKCRECGIKGKLRTIPYPERMTLTVTLCDKCYEIEIEKAIKQAKKDFLATQWKGKKQ